MPIGMQEEDGGKLMKIALVGTLVKEDYGPLAAEFARLAKLHGQVRVLLDMTRFQGWEISALWREIKFDLKNLNKLERLAIIGETRWQHAIASVAKPITHAEIRYFNYAQVAEAYAWLSDRASQYRPEANAA